MAEDYEKKIEAAWVLERSSKRGIRWFPNLRLLVSYGILKHEDTTRGGRRAYYTMPDPEGVEKALRELELLGGQPKVGVRWERKAKT